MSEEPTQVFEMKEKSKDASAKRQWRAQWHPSDVVALVLAMGFSITIILILVGSIVQITHGSFPQVNLSENATQVLIAGIGGFIGLLGAYIGVNRRGKDGDE